MLVCQTSYHGFQDFMFVRDSLNAYILLVHEMRVNQYSSGFLETVWWYNMKPLETSNPNNQWDWWKLTFYTVKRQVLVSNQFLVASTCLNSDRLFLGHLRIKNQCTFLSCAYNRLVPTNKYGNEQGFIDIQPLFCSIGGLLVCIQDPEL